MNKPQAEGRVNPVCTEERWRSSTIQHSSAIKNNVSLSKVIFAY